MLKKELDLIVANDVNRPDAGFPVDTNEVTLISREGEVDSLPLMSKEEVVQRLLDWLARRLAGGEGEGEPCLIIRPPNFLSWWSSWQG